MTAQRRTIGGYGERCAVRHLVDMGFRVVARNWRCRDGEIDIVAWDRDVLVFCEVKTRRSETYGRPAEAVGWRKARRLRMLAARWLRDNEAHPREIRFDVVEVRPARSGAARVDHLRNAF